MPPPSRQSRHLWVGNLPEDVDKESITDYFSRFGKVEGVHILPQRYPGQGIAAFVDFYDVHSAVDAVQSAQTFSGREIRVNYKFKDGGGGPRFGGRQEQGSPHRDRERYSDKKSQRRSRSKSASSSSSSSSSSAASKEGSRARSASPRSSRSSSSSSSSSDTTKDDDKKRKASKRRSRSRSRSTSPPRLGLFVKVSNLPSRPTDNTVREELYFDLRKHCDLHTVRIYRDNGERYAVVKFRNVVDSQKMYSECNGRSFMGSKMKLTAWHPERRRSFYDNYQSSDHHHGNQHGGRQMQHYSGGAGDDTLEPETTRTLFVGNIPRSTSVYELKDNFIRFGHILDVEIKKGQGQATYGFVLFFDLMSARTAKKFMDGTMIGRNTIKVGFGKGPPSKCLWVDGVDPTMSDSNVEKHFSRYGTIVNIGFDRQRCTVVVAYNSVDIAKEAMLDLRGTIIGKTRVRVLVDFCSKEAGLAFFQALEQGDLDGPDFPPGFDPWVPPGPGRGGFNPHGRQFYRGHQQMDYGYNPYMEGRGRGGYHMDHMSRYQDPDYDDYGEQLRAYSAKKEREKDYHQRRHRRKSSSSESGSRSSEEGERSSKKGRRRHTKSSSDREASDTERKGRHTRKTKSSVRDGRADSDSDAKDVRSKKTRKKPATPPSDKDRGKDSEDSVDEKASNKQEATSKKDDSEDEADKKQILKFKVAKKPRIEPSAMLSSDSEVEDVDTKNKQTKSPPHGTQKGQVIPKDEDISGGDLSDMDDEDLGVSKTKKAEDEDDDKKGKTLKDKRSRSYRGKADDMDGDDSDDAMLKKEDSSKKTKASTKELPLRYREEDDSSVKRNRRDRPQSPSSPPPVFDRRGKYGTSPRRYGNNSNRRRSQGSSSPHHRQQQQDSKTHRSGSGGHPYYGSWQRVKSPRPQQRGRRSRSPDKRHQGDDDQLSRYSSQRGRSDKRKSAGETNSEVKRRRTEAGGPRSPSATPPLPPDMEEPRPQLPTEPPPIQPEAPLPTEGSFMPSLKDTKPIAATATTTAVQPPSQPYPAQPLQQQLAQQPGADTLVELLRRYPVMWQGHFTLKNDMAAVQLHFLSGNMELAKKSLPFPTQDRPTPSLRIAQRMRLEATQIEGVEKRIQMVAEHCLLLALPCGRDPLDVHAQTRALKTSFISYLMQKQAAGIINVTSPQQANFVLHIFPPCPFSHGHLARVAPDLLSSASDSGHLMVIIATT